MRFAVCTGSTDGAKGIRFDGCKIGVRNRIVAITQASQKVHGNVEFDESASSLF